MNEDHRPAIDGDPVQVVAPEELFYEILLRQRAERAKFIAILETMEKQTPVLEGKPSSEDLLKVMRLEHGGRAARPDRRTSGRYPPGNEAKPGWFAKSHRLLQDGVIDRCGFHRWPDNQLRGVLQSLTGAGSSPVANLESARRLKIRSSPR